MLRHLAAANLLRYQLAAARAGRLAEAILPHLRTAAYASESDPAKPKGWVPQWLRERLPESVGGIPASEETEELTLDKFASTLRQARRLGSVTSYLPGAGKLSDPVQNANLLQYERIIEAMSAEDKADPSRLGAAARQRVAQASDCTVAQVDDCLAKWQWMRTMLARVQEAKRQGKPLPDSIEDMERTVGGTWRNFKAQQPAAASQAVQQDGRTPHRVAPSSEHTVPVHAVSAKGMPCPLAGRPASRNTKCPLTRKAYKACCGRYTLQ